MRIRAEWLLPIAFLASGCCSMSSLPGIPASIPTLHLSLPAAPAPPVEPSGTKASPVFTRPGGLGELLEAQRQVAHGTKNAGTLQLSKKALKAEMDKVLDAVHQGRFGAIPAALGVDSRAAPQLEQFFRTYFEAYFRKFQVLNTGGEEAGFFYNRAGQKFGFPTITVSVNAPQASRLFEVTRIDEIAVIGDLTRVTIEALGDWLSPNVPADATSTGCVTGLLKAPACVAAADKKLRCIVKIADTTEAIVGYAAAHAVRGGWWASLNNEALAKSIQVTLSVTARKMAEERATAVSVCRDAAPPAPLDTATLRVDLVD